MQRIIDHAKQHDMEMINLEARSDNTTIWVPLTAFHSNDTKMFVCYPGMCCGLHGERMNHNTLCWRFRSERSEQFGI